MDTPQRGTPGSSRPPSAQVEQPSHAADCRDTRSQPDNSGRRDDVWAAIEGNAAAVRVIDDLRRTASPPDTLYAALQAVLAIGQRERLRAFVRTLQKAIAP